MLADILHKNSLARADEAGEWKFSPRPSSAGTERCTRQMVYHGCEVPRDNKMSGRMYETMDDSSFHEELTIDRLRDSAFKIHSRQMGISIEGMFPSLLGDKHCRECSENSKVEMKVQRSCLHGHIDGIITNLMLEDLLFEHKAINHFTWQKYWKGDEMPLDYITQCAIYLRGLHFVIPDIRRGVLLLKNKNTSQYIEYILEYDFDKDIISIVEMVSSIGDERKYPDFKIENIVHNAVAKFNQVLKYINDKHLPKREYDLDDWRCEYCGWQNTCWADYQKEFGEMTKGVELSQDCVDACALFNQTKGQIRTLVKVADDAQEQVKQIMIDANCTEGYAKHNGEVYAISRKFGESHRINKELIPADILLKVTKVIPTETLTIKNITEKPENETKAGKKPQPKKPAKKEGEDGKQVCGDKKPKDI